MPFANYTALDQVARRYRIRCRQGGFLEPVPARLGEYFRSELEFTLNEVPFRRTETFACETIIYPLLREVWKPFRETLALWSHEGIAYDEDLCGVPDYLIARRSPLGVIVLDVPYLVVVEAKKDDFERGWGECLAAMLAAQKLNGLEDQAIYGISTNGRSWEFGELSDDVFTQDPRPYGLHDVDGLGAAINFVMTRCHESAAGHPVAAV